MEQKIEITCPVSVGDKLYRTNSDCEIKEEIIERISIKTEAGVNLAGRFDFNEKTYITIYTKDNHYNPSELGHIVFLDKKELIQKLVNQL